MSTNAESKKERYMGYFFALWHVKHIMDEIAHYKKAEAVMEWIQEEITLNKYNVLLHEAAIEHIIHLGSVKPKKSKKVLKKKESNNTTSTKIRGAS